MVTQSPWRLALLAQLAKERSFLLRQLWALNIDTLTTTPVNDGRTAKEIIAHVAAWDSLVMSRIRMVGNGRVQKIEPLGVGKNRDAFNADLRARYQKYDLKLTLAFALRERSNLLYAFNQLTDKELEQPIHLPWGEETRLRDWFIQRHEHDAIHAQELAAWRKQLPLPVKRQVGPKLILRAILRATRKEFLSLVDLIPPEDRDTTPVRGEWTLKDLVGHLTDWEQLSLSGLRQLLLGQTPEFTPITDFAAFDEVGIQARRSQSWPQVWRAFTTSRQALDDTFQQFPEPFLTHQLTTPWGKEMAAYFWLTITFGHDHEHAADVRRAINRPDHPHSIQRSKSTV